MAGNGGGDRQEQEGHHAHMAVCSPRVYGVQNLCLRGWFPSPAESFSREPPQPSVLTSPAQLSEEPRNVKGASSISVR